MLVEIPGVPGLKDSDTVLCELMEGVAGLTIKRERLRRAQALVCRYVTSEARMWTN